MSPTAEIRFFPRPSTEPITVGEPIGRGRHRAQGFPQPPSQPAAGLEHHAGGGFCTVCGVPWPCWASEQPVSRARHRG